MARHSICHARLRSVAAGSNSFLPSLHERPTFHCVVPKAQRASAVSAREAMTEKPSFFSELKRRNVYKVAVAYIVAGWALSQGIAQVFPVFDVPNWAIRLVVLLIIIGFPIALIFAWAFEVTPQGIQRTEAADAAGLRSRGVAWIYVVLIGAALSVGLFFVGRYTAGNAAPRHSEAATTVRGKSIAVLPLVNESG